MGATFSRYFVEAPGNTILADHWNGELDNILDNLTPSGIDDMSSNAAAMQTVTSPGTVGGESLPTSLTGEIQRLRYMIKLLGGGDQWYSTPQAPEGSTRNLALTLSAGVLTITGASAGLTTDNTGQVTCPDANGVPRTLNVVTDLTLRDDSDLTNWEAGITSTSNWAVDMPWFLYVANRDNTDIDGVDGNSVFFISRVPNLRVTYSTASWIGDTSAIPVTDTQNSILILADVTVADYVNLPCTLVGAFRMRYATATNGWTVQSIAGEYGDGFGKSQLDKCFSRVWTFPAGQMGASANTFVLPHGGTAPTFTTNNCTYRLTPQGVVSCQYQMLGDGGTPGAGAVSTQVATPFGSYGQGYTHPVGHGAAMGVSLAGAGVYGNFQAMMAASVSYFTLSYYNDGTGVHASDVQNTEFGHSSDRSIYAKVEFVVW